MSDLIKKEQTEIQSSPNQVRALTSEEVRMYICQNASVQEIERFKEQCERHQLDPLKREIYLVKYGSSPAETIVGFETYLKRANRTNRLNGWDVKMDDGDKSATITIFRKDWDHDFKWTVYAKEFNKGQSTWKTMFTHMLRKVAIAQGMRLCFPEETDGLPYIKEELELSNFTQNAQPPTKAIEGKTTVEKIINRVNNNKVITSSGEEEARVEHIDKVQKEAEVEYKPTISKAQQKLLFTVLEKSDKPKDYFRKYLSECYNIGSTSELLKSEMDNVMDWIKNCPGNVKVTAEGKEDEDNLKDE